MTNFLPKGYVLPAFKDMFGSQDEYLQAILNSTGKIQQSDFDARKVSGGFVSSDIFLLHDGKFKKTVATAFHIPNKEGKIHHFNIHLVRFRRKDTKSNWEIECVRDLRDKEVKELKEFITKQDGLLGKTVEKKYVKVVSTDSPYVLGDLDDVLDKILNLDDGALSKLSEDGYSKISDLIERLLNNDQIVISKNLYLQLKKAKYSPRSVKRYEDELTIFRELISNTESTETDMQDFLQDKVWFFGLNYQQSHRKSKPKFCPTLGTEYDFLLEGFNEVYDIAELKGPNDLLIEKYSVGNRKQSFDPRIDYRYSAKFARALHQILDYLHEFEDFFERIKENQPSISNFLYPKGIIVISKRKLFPDDGKNSTKYLHLLNRQFSSIEILTYDDLATRGQIIVDFIKAVEK